MTTTTQQYAQSRIGRPIESGSTVNAVVGDNL